MIFNHLKFSSLGAPEWWLVDGGKPTVHNIRMSVVVTDGHMWQSVEKAPFQLSLDKHLFQFNHQHINFCNYSEIDVFSNDCHHAIGWCPKYVFMWCVCVVFLYFCSLHVTIHSNIQCYGYHNVHITPNLSTIGWHLNQILNVLCSQIGIKRKWRKTPLQQHAVH